MNNKYSDITWENILRMPSDTILEKVLEFCEEFDYDISEVLDVFDDKTIKAEFYAELVMKGVISDPEFKEVLEKRLNDW